MTYQALIGISMGISKTGMILKAQLEDAAGELVGGEVTTGFVERGGGHYTWMATIPVGFRGVIKFRDVAETIDWVCTEVNPEDSEMLRLLRERLSAGQIVVSSPVAPNGTANIIQGDDYSADDNRSLRWSSTNENGWPDLTGATIGFVAKQGTTLFEKDMVATVPTGSEKQVQLELTSIETAAMTIGPWIFDIEATLSNSHRVTLARGAMSVQDRVD